MEVPYIFGNIILRLVLDDLAGHFKDGTKFFHQSSVSKLWNGMMNSGAFVMVAFSQP
jgi:hypothetical protein